MTDQPQMLAILFVNVVDSRESTEPTARAATSPDVEKYLSMVRDIAAEFGGAVLKSASDSIMYSFPDAEAAVLAACSMQTNMRNVGAVPENAFKLRIGMHVGTPLTAGVAAQRMATFARNGQIITTPETVALLPAAQREAALQHSVPRQNKREAIIVHEVVWKPDNNETATSMRPFGVPRAGANLRLRLTHADREVMVVMSINIGRRSSHGIPLKDPKASRDHACITRREDQFVLIDQSTHGTFVRLQNGKEHELRHQELVLSSNGVMSFGRRVSEQGAERVMFFLEPEEGNA